ncbi:deleted in malignant brain tumors 1 protein-like [Montipora capricornis]
MQMFQPGKGFALHYHLDQPCHWLNYPFTLNMLAQHRFLFIISAFILAELHINAAQCLGDVSNPKIINLLDGENGSIYSPNYPSAYGSNENCNWLFNATRARVLIYFTFMDFENCCGCDYVEIFDGPSDSYNSLIMKGCDTSFPRPVYSSGRYLFMKFKSDYSIQARGFVAHYKALSRSSVPVCPSINRSASVGVIYSPNFPWGYSFRSQSCHWTISAPNYEQISLRFIKMNLDCSGDYVRVQPYNRRFCGHTVPYTSYAYGGMNVTFFSLRGRSSGFIAFYQIGSRYSSATPAPTAYPYTYHGLTFPFQPTFNPYTHHGLKFPFQPTPTPAFNCKPQSDSSTYTYVGTDRSLSVSGQRNSYYSYFSRCSWVIYTDEENIIQLTFDRMSMRSDYYSNCRTAYVQVIDGGSYTGTTIGTYCSDQGKTVFSTGNRLLIIFYSGGYYGMDSFEATVRARKAVAVKAVEIVVPIVVAVILFAVILTVIMLTRSAVRRAGLAQSANNVPMQSRPNCTQEPPPPDSSQLVSPVNTVSANLSI